MKKNLFRNILIFIFVLMTFSCTNLIEPIENQGLAYEKTACIKLSLGNEVDSRTVLPASDETVFTDFVLKGTKQGESEETLGSWATVSDLKNAVLPVTTGSWSFTLTAKQGGTIFAGTTSENIIPGENSLFFNLVISDFGTDAGSFSITLSFADASNADRVTKAVAALENLDGSMVSALASQVLTPSENTVTFSGNGITAGTYRAKVIFYTTEDGTDFELATYRELVQISSDLASTAIRTIESFDSLYTITYNLNSGIPADGVSLQETVTRKSEAIILPELTRDYYTFDGWYAEEGFTEGTQVTALSSFTDNVKVYAKFTPITYTITYVLNGGINPDTVVTSYTVEDDVTLPIPDKGEEAFGGWFETEDFSTIKYKSWSAGTINGNKILYAKYNGIKVTAENIVEKITNMTESGTLKVSGEFSDKLLDQINSALISLGKNRPDVLVSLDLEDVTGMSVFEYNWSSAHTNDKKAFYKCNNLESIILPDGLISIGSRAFYGCTRLKSVTIPDGVTSIGQLAFGECTGLISITIPDSVTSIEGSAFNGCNSLREMTISLDEVELNKNLSYTCVFGFFFGYTTDKTVAGTVNQGKGITINNKWETCYYYIPSSLKKVTITGQHIPSGFFRGCSMIEEIVFGNATDIGETAFYGCTGLTEITIPDSVTSIGNEAFYGCTGLTEIIIPDSVTSIGSSAFLGCSGLKKITIPDSVTSIGGSAFHSCTGLTSITIPDSVTSIGGYAFYDCTGLTSITIPDSVTSIGDKTFYGCTGLTEITISDSVTSIGKDAFYDCTGLTSIIIPDSVTSIGSGAFGNCTRLTSITIPDSITSIETSVFKNCTGLTEITIPNNVTSIGFGAFYGCTGLKKITIPDSVTKIDTSAFRDCSSLSSITISANCTIIGQLAFGNTSIRSITIPASVVKMGNRVFKDCAQLTSITFKDPNNWYRTTSYSYEDGTKTKLSTGSSNATMFKKTYVDYYWYKK